MVDKLLNKFTVVTADGSKAMAMESNKKNLSALTSSLLNSPKRHRN